MAGYQFGEVVMLQLGGYQFGINTAAYQELTRAASWTWAPQERFGQMPGQQYTGPGEETISLPGLIFPEWRGGFGQVAQMRALAAEAKPLPLVDGAGASMGRWVIVRVDETQSTFAAAGAPRRVEFTIELRRFPDEPPAAPAEAATEGTEAAGVAVPAGASTTVEKVRGLANSASSAATSLSGALSGAAYQIGRHVAPITEVAREALGGVLRAESVVSEIQTVANRTLALIGVSPIEATALNGANNLAARAAGLILSAESAAVLLRNSSARLDQLGTGSPEAGKALRDAQAVANRTVAMTRAVATGAAEIGE